MDAIKVGEKIKQLLLQNAKRSQVKDKSVFICCPFHGENTPSCAVTIFSDKFIPGTFHCFGCGEKGIWNKLAEKLNLNYRINSKDISATINASIAKFSEDDLLKVNTESVEEFIKSMHFDSYTEMAFGE